MRCASRKRIVVHIHQTPSAMSITTQIDALMNAAASSANHFSEEVSDARLARSDRRARPLLSDEGISTPRHDAPATCFAVRDRVSVEHKRGRITLP
jgi:hypothetical protein